MFNSGCPKAQYLAQFCILCTQHYVARSLKNTTLTIIMYADDTQLYKSVPFSDLQLLVQSIETCSGNVKKWMTDNKLKLNNEKKNRNPVMWPQEIC